MPETIYFPLGWDRGKAAPFLERDRVLSLLAAECQLPGPPGGGPLTARSFPSETAHLSQPRAFSLALKRDAQTPRPDTRINNPYGCVGVQAWLNFATPKDCSLPGSSVHRMFQARILEWVAILSSRGSS